MLDGVEFPGVAGELERVCGGTGVSGFADEGAGDELFRLAFGDAFGEGWPALVEPCCAFSEPCDAFGDALGDGWFAFGDGCCALPGGGMPAGFAAGLKVVVGVVPGAPFGAEPEASKSGLLVVVPEGPMLTSAWASAFVCAHAADAPTVDAAMMAAMDVLRNMNKYLLAHPRTKWRRPR